MSPASAGSSWIESSDVLSLFPTLVWTIRLRPEVREAIGASILPLLNSLREGLPEPRSGEAWQSGHSLHRREELRELCKVVARVVPEKAANAARWDRSAVVDRIVAFSKTFHVRRKVDLRKLIGEGRL